MYPCNHQNTSIHLSPNQTKPNQTKPNQTDTGSGQKPLDNLTKNELHILVGLPHQLVPHPGIHPQRFILASGPAIEILRTCGVAHNVISPVHNQERDLNLTKLILHLPANPQQLLSRGCTWPLHGPPRAC
ncbi:RNA-binding (RRM/RBD/RNP motifs) family protein [Striga asiatica]|uniref:RNA-binding (RRM/RBD/RNP motifs) family protein n=1 Tax=Striga asiatica TaxID=4170 RepID=A0A5A7R0S8_STRAF|nr:RNA-binding (RRM/RBD/RNP motifs) family protein [Striga asiatica]